jgi:DNA-directed RNA polymerase subunit K/omega
MTKKDYILIANAIRKEVERARQEKEEGVISLNNLLENLGEEFIKENKNFSFPRFIDACGI